MKNRCLVEPDLKFIDAIKKAGGDSLKKCIQCASCTVVCKLSPDLQPFPRKEMLYAGWGLKDRLVGNPDIWLCYNCGDCSDLCPRQAMPGDTLGAIRRLSIKEYSKPSAIHRLFDDPRYLPVLFILPALIITAVGLSTGLLNLQHDGGPIVYARFFPVSLIEIIFIPLPILTGLILFIGIRKMLADMQANFFYRGLSNDTPVEPVAFLKTLVTTLPEIIKHEKFATCTQNRGRKLSHMLVSFSYLNLALVAGTFVFALYILDSHGPYSQLNPIKIFANLSGIALIAGSLMLIKDRLKSHQEQSFYFDWYLLGLSLFLGITGMITQFLRLADRPEMAIAIYFIHLVLVFNLIAFLPYSKLAHFIYRTVAVTYSAYARKEQR
ncbi:MAG: quinone-interacting membrane-bound oxidoreductase complex subunit QmoC [Desulfobacterales bacterium]|nr:quinone-interacting membrane-bound oxidoreductase complex subunit QmoC [Desulfobacterales bacterium]